MYEGGGRGSDFDRWDLELRGGLTGAVRIKVMTEDQGDQKQLIRWRVIPQCPPITVLTIAVTLTVAAAPAVEHHPRLATALLVVAGVAVALAVRACGAVSATFCRVCQFDEVA